MTLDELLATYNALRRDLTDYDAEYGPILQHRTALAQELQEAQDRLTEAMYASGVKTLPLTRGLYSLVDGEDFDRVAAHRWCISGTPSHPYAMNRRLGYLHRFILEAKTGTEVDHINGYGLDNRRVNLRECSHAENIANGRFVGGLSGFRGVFWNKRKQKWVAQITHRNKRITIGYFSNLVDASEAYDLKAVELFGEFARPNSSRPAKPYVRVSVKTGVTR